MRDGLMTQSPNEGAITASYSHPLIPLLMEVAAEAAISRPISAPYQRHPSHDVSSCSRSSLLAPARLLSS